MREHGPLERACIKLLNAPATNAICKTSFLSHCQCNPGSKRRCTKGMYPTKYIIFEPNQAQPAPITPNFQVAHTNNGISNTKKTALPIKCNRKSPLAYCK